MSKSAPVHSTLPSPPGDPPTTKMVEGQLHSIALRTFIIIASAIITSGGALALCYSIGFTPIFPLVFIGVGAFLVGGVAAWGVLDECFPRYKTITVPQTPAPPPPSPTPPFVPSSSSASKSASATSSRSLETIEKLLEQISNLGRDSKNLDQMNERLNSEEIKKFERENTKSDETPDPKTGVGQALYRIKDLRLLHEQLTQIKKEIHHFRSWTMDDKGVISVPGDGNCAFHAFIASYKLIESGCTLTHTELRTQTVAWIRSNIATNPRIRRLVLHAMLAFYYAKNERVKDDIDGLKAILGNPKLYTADPKEVTSQIETSRLIIQNTQAKINIILEQLSLSDEFIKIDTEGDIFKDYIANISKSGVFASAAELSALAEMKGVRLEVYDNNRKLLPPVFNESAPKERIVRIKQNEFQDHFDAYVPPSE